MPSAATSPRSSVRDNLLVWALIALVGWLYLTDAWRTTKALDSVLPLGLYGLQTEAWYHGQLHYLTTPDPRLADLANPYNGYQGVPRLHDASYYRNQYTMYFGVTPVALLQLPWRGLMGTYLADGITTAVFSFLGFALAARWLADLRRRYFPQVGIAWLLVFLAVLAFGTPLYAISSSPTFYTVPISSAFFCSMLMVSLLTRALTHASPAAAPWYIAGASLMGGLAVGARPVHVLALAALLPPCALLIHRAARSERRRTAQRLALAALLPAGGVGLLLGLHNYLRYDNPLEFGMRYALTGADITAVAIMGAKYIPENIRMYFFRTLDFTHAFPFFFNSTRPYGVIPYLPITLAVLALPVLWWRRRRDLPPEFGVSATAVLLVALANFSVLSLFHWSETRYMVDFAPTLALAGAAAGLALLASLARSARPLRLVSQTALALAATWTLLAGTFIALPAKAPRPLYAAGEHASNWLAYQVGRLTGATYGPLEARIRFPAKPAHPREPILTTGGLNGTGDILYVRYESPELVRFGFFHLGAGGPESNPVPITPGREYRLSIELGSLLPPPGHPAWRDAPEKSVTHTRRKLAVSLDGQIALQATVETYPSTPDRTKLGANALALDVCAASFSGEITGATRRSFQPLPPPTYAQTGAFLLTFTLPPPGVTAPQPLLTTGRQGAGDLISLERLPDGRFRFGHDFWGGEQWLSAPIALAEDGEHRLEVHLASLRPTPSPLPPLPLWGRLVLRVDGQQIADVERPFNPSGPDEIAFAYNAIRSSAAVTSYSGTVLEAKPIETPEPPAAQPD